MAKVYIVTCSDGDRGSMILGVYSSLELAQEGHETAHGRWVDQPLQDEGKDGDCPAWSNGFNCNVDDDWIHVNEYHLDGGSAMLRYLRSRTASRS